MTLDALTSALADRYAIKREPSGASGSEVHSSGWDGGRRRHRPAAHLLEPSSSSLWILHEL